MCNESVFEGYFLRLVGLLYVKGHKIESQENIKEEFDIGVVLWFTHIYQLR